MSNRYQALRTKPCLRKGRRNISQFASLSRRTNELPKGMQNTSYLLCFYLGEIIIFDNKEHWYLQRILACAFFSSHHSNKLKATADRWVRKNNMEISHMHGERSKNFRILLNLHHLKKVWNGHSWCLATFCVFKKQGILIKVICEWKRKESHKNRKERNRGQEKDRG